MTGERPRSPVSLAGLVRSRTVAALGTLHAGAPFVSMVPFAVLPEGDAFVIHVSRLAAHTKDMIDDPRVFLLIMQPEGEGAAAQALARVSIQGEAREMEQGSEQARACREAYLARFPEAAPLTVYAATVCGPAFSRTVRAGAPRTNARLWMAPAAMAVTPLNPTGTLLWP